MGWILRQMHQLLNNGDERPKVNMFYGHHRKSYLDSLSLVKKDGKTILAITQQDLSHLGQDEIKTHSGLFEASVIRTRLGTHTQLQMR